MVFDRVRLHGASGFVSILGFSRLSLYRYLCNTVFMCVIPVVFYLQLNGGSFESKHSCFMFLSLFKLTTCFGLCNYISCDLKMDQFKGRNMSSA